MSTTLWTEKTAETFSLAGRAVELVRARGPAELEAVAVARLSQTYGMRGDVGDIDRSIELGDQALDLWSGDDRLLELAEAYHMQADVHYWTGSFERALELSAKTAETGGLEPRNAEFLLRGGGMEGLILAGMGRYEEALAAGDLAIETARKLGRKDNVVLNSPTAALREVFALDEGGYGARPSPTGWGRRASTCRGSTHGPICSAPSC